jgi:phospholipase C
VTLTTEPTAVDAEHPCGYSLVPPDTYDHVIWIWMENKNADILHGPHAPFLASLAAQCGSASDYRDNGLHPSLPNYIAATSGDPQGIDNDSGPAQNSTTADNIFRQVRAIGGSAKSYLESMDQNCQLGGAGPYAVKHNPAAYYTGGDDRSACQRDAVPFEAFAEDLAAGALPAFASVSPDLCHDMHDCPISDGDEWLSLVVTSITGSATYRAGRTVLFIVWDESSGGGTMPFVAVAPAVPNGTVVDLPLGHAALLAFTEDALGISEHLGAAADALDLGTAFGL